MPADLLALRRFREFNVVWAWDCVMPRALVEAYPARAQTRRVHKVSPQYTQGVYNNQVERKQKYTSY